MILNTWCRKIAHLSVLLSKDTVEHPSSVCHVEVPGKIRYRQLAEYHCALNIRSDKQCSSCGICSKKENK